MAQFARTQPQGLARINRSNPLARGLQFAWSGATPIVDAVSQTTATRTNVASTVGPSGIAAKVSGGNGSSIAFSNPAISAAMTGDITLLALARVASTAEQSMLGQTTGGGGTNSPFDFGVMNGQIRLVRSNANYRIWMSGSSLAPVGTAPSVLAVVGSAAMETPATFYLNGVKDTAAPVNQYSSVGTGQAIANSNPLYVLGRNDGSTPYQGDIYLGLAWNRKLSDAEIASISANPWQLFDAPSQTQFPRAAAAGTGAALSGAASAVASATGSLTTSIPLAASAAVIASASASLSTQIALAGAAAGQATGSGALATQIRLSGSAGAVAAASGALSTQIALTGTATGAATAAGALSTQISLAGTAAASSSASGALTAGTGLSGSASASSSASGTLTTSIRLAGSASCNSSASGDLSTTPVGAALSGAAAATSSASGSLSTAIKLAGAAVAQASASGSLAGQAATLSGSASAVSSASGSLSTQIVVAGAAQAVASAVGSLTTAIRLAGSAACSSSATGSLSTGLLPPEPNPHRMIVVPRRKRHFVARHRVRHFEAGR